VPSKLQIYNGALVTHLDTRPLKALTDARTERRALDSVWDETLEWMIEQGMWNFAARSQMWEPSPSATPEFGQSYAYEKPDDYVRLIYISDNETLKPTLREFLEEGDYFIAYASPIYVQFVSDDPAWGADPGKWKPAFTTAFEAELAWRAQGGIKALSTIDKESLRKLKRRLLQDAQSKDVVNQAPTEMPAGRLVTARGGLRGNALMRRTPYG
jgi:hypothetical protein